MDMITNYTRAVREHLPNVSIVFDRYHPMVLINRQVDGLRREQQHHIDTQETNTLKRNRFLMLRNYHELANDKKGRLDELLTVN